MVVRVRAVFGCSTAPAGSRCCTAGKTAWMRLEIRLSFILLSFMLVAGVASACAPVQGATAAPVATAVPAAFPARSVAAATANATLTITQPPAGGSIPAGSLMVTLDYTGPNLVPVASATELNQYHVHYFLDVDPTPYIGTTTPIPTGNPHVIHTAETQVMFDNVAPGTHQLAVVLTGSNHISVNPPVAQQITFTVT